MPPILTLKQLTEITSAFDDFSTVEDSTLPEYYKQLFPHKCQCGGEVILTTERDGQQGFTQLQCCNPDCWIKMAHRFSYFAKSLGFKGFGETSSVTMYRNLYTEFQYPTFLSIFEVPENSIEAINGQAYAVSFKDMKEQLARGAFQFKDAISALGIPDLGSGSRIFDVVKSPVTLLDYILYGKTDTLCEMAGIYAPKSRYFLKTYRLDIVTLAGSVMPNIMSTPSREVNVAITGHVVVDGTPLTRMEFIQKCEQLLDKNGAPAYKIIETKSSSKLEFVIADTKSSSSKYKLGQQLGILITAQEFYDKLKKSLGEETSNE